MQSKVKRGLLIDLQHYVLLFGWPKSGALGLDRVHGWPQARKNVEAVIEIPVASFVMVTFA
jgi:hypothetical protein